MGRTYSKEAKAQELQMEGISLIFKGLEYIRQANGVLSDVNHGPDAFNEHARELGFSTGGR